MGIYTKTGDLGETHLRGGARVSKADLRVKTYGVVDELCASIGVASVFSGHAESKQLLQSVQARLFKMGAELAMPYAPDLDNSTPGEFLEEVDIEFLEENIDLTEAKLPKQSGFIFPGGDASAAHLFFSATICRRLERELVALHKKEPVRILLLQFVNRLGDFLFIIARGLNHWAGVKDQTVKT